MTRLRAAVLLGFLSVLSCCLVTSASVILIGNGETFCFPDIEANFTPSIKGSGECGVLYLAEPLDACSDLTNQVDNVTRSRSPFALVIGGGCCSEEKVRTVQKAGFRAAIIYDNEDDGDLFSMVGDAAVIKIHAIFISKAWGKKLNKYAGRTDMKLCLIPNVGNSAGSIMAISFISLLTMSAVLGTCLFVRRHRIRRERPRSSTVCSHELHGMSKRRVKTMPSLTFTTVLEDNSTSRTCAICLEDYTVGEKLRILPCRHKFHAFCVDSWLTTWRTFCPVCKRDARTSTGDPRTITGDPCASESTPLLSPSPASVGSSVLSSFRSSLASSSAIRIAPASSRSPSISHIHSLASAPYIQQSLRSYRQSPPISVSRNSVDLRNASSQRSHASHLGYPSVSPLNARYMSPYYPSPSNASASLVSSSGHQLHPLHCSESAASFSPFASAHSLPEC